jgi:Flp pilus assembly protein TadG
MITGSDKTLIRDRRGQSMIEYALILPLMVLVVAGIFDLGRAFYASISITNAAREGARYGTLHPNDYPGIKTAAVNEAQSSNIVINANDVVITCPDFIAPTGCDRGQPLRVTVNHLYDDMIFRFFFKNGIQMQRYVEMQVP